MKKIIIHAAKTCGGTYEINYTEDNLPFLVCDKCQHKVEDWIKWHAEYKNYWTEQDRWVSKKDYLVCLLGYFNHLFTEHYGFNFTFSLSERGLFNGSEASHIRKAYALCDNDTSLTRTYFDWLFKTKVKDRKKKITSLGFVAVPEIVNEFKQAHKKSKIIARSTPLPEQMLKWITIKAPGVNDVISMTDFGDLHMLLSHITKVPDLAADKDIERFIDKLKKSNIITDELKIRNWREEC